MSMEWIYVLLLATLLLWLFCGDNNNDNNLA